MRNKLLRWGLSVLTMVSVATVLLLITGWGSAIASSVSSVVVTNTASNPVPVTPTGTVPVHEQGTAKAQEQNVDGNGNIKVHEQGTANVNVTNSTVPVHEQGTAAVRLANEDVSVTDPGYQNDSGSLCGGPVYTVPDGKDLVVMYIGAFADGTNSSPGGARGWLYTGDGSVLLPFVYQSQTTNEAGFGQDSFAASDAVHYVFGPGTTISVSTRVPDSSTCFVRSSLGGYLQPAG